MSLPVDPHNRVKRSKHDVEEEEDSPAERALRKVGCLELHYRVQECMGEHRDWRMCKDDVRAFKECIERSKREEAAAE